MNNKILARIPNIIALLIMVFMLIPIIILFINAFNPDFMTFPPTSVTLQWFVAFSQSKEYQQSLRISTLVASSAVGIALLAGIPAAFAIDRYSFPGRTFMQGLFLSPLLLPGIVWALGLIEYYAFLRILGSFPGLVFAYSIIVVPYVIRLVLASFSFVDRDLENAANSLGASPLRTFFEITVPLVAPGIIVSAVFGFMICFTDVVIATFVAGARYITFPVRVYSQLRSQGVDPMTVAISAIVMTVIIVVALVGEKLVRWSRYI